MSGARRYVPPAPLPGDLAWALIDGDNLLHRIRGTRDEGSIRWLLPHLRAWRPADVRVVLMLDGHPEPGETLRRQVVTGIEVRYSGPVDGDTALLRLLGSRPYEDRIRTVVVTDDRALGDRARHLHAFVRRLDWFVGQLTAAGSGTRSGSRPPAVRAADGGDRIAGGGRPGPRGGGRPGSGGRPPATAGRPQDRGPGLGEGLRPTGVGAGRAPRRVPGMVGGDPGRESDGAPEREPWRPGRGATRKRGNPRRGHPAG